MSEIKRPSILLIRHGETQWNIEGRLQGGQDAPLTLNGFRQVCAVAENTRHIRDNMRRDCKITYLTSPLGRARQTTSILSDCWGTDYSDFQFDDAIKERNYGAWEGMTLSEVSESRTTEFEAHQTDPWGYRVPGGESKTGLCARIEDWLQNLSADHRYVVVTHSGCFRVIRGLYVGATQTEMDDYREPQTTSYLLEDGLAREIRMEKSLERNFQLNPKALTVSI